MSGLLSFLLGTGGRMLFGEIAAAYTKNQDHKHEKELLILQNQHENDAHARNLAALQAQHAMGMQVVEANVAAHAKSADDDAWLSAVDAAAGKQKSGVAWVDAWNQCIRPTGATLALVMIAVEAVALGAIPATTTEVLFAFLGLYVGDRSLKHRGK